MAEKLVTRYLLRTACSKLMICARTFKRANLKTMFCSNGRTKRALNCPLPAVMRALL